MKACPSCSGAILDGVVICPHCGLDLQFPPEPPVRGRALTLAEVHTARRRQVVLLLVFPAVVLVWISLGYLGGPAGMAGFALMLVLPGVATASSIIALVTNRLLHRTAPRPNDGLLFALAIGETAVSGTIFVLLTLLFLILYELSQQPPMW